MTIGLFGTCGKTTWRKDFIDAYDARGIEYFNPQVPSWSQNTEFAQTEARHLVNDEIILFPVTAETAGLGSLAETGFSMFQAMKTNANRYFVFYIAPTVDPNYVTDAAVAKESNRTRALVRAHFQKNTHPNVFVCEEFSQILPISLALYESILAIKKARQILEYNGTYAT